MKKLFCICISLFLSFFVLLAASEAGSAALGVIEFTSYLPPRLSTYLSLVVSFFILFAGLIGSGGIGVAFYEMWTDAPTVPTEAVDESSISESRFVIAALLLFSAILSIPYYVAFTNPLKGGWGTMSDLLTFSGFLWRVLFAFLATLPLSVVLQAAFFPKASVFNWRKSVSK
jgi:hypothetical protein